MQPTAHPNPPSRWTPTRVRRALVVLIVLGASSLYCLGFGGVYLKRQLLTAPTVTATESPTATIVPRTPTPVPVIQLPEQTLDPTPTQMTLVFPTAKPTSTLTETPPGEETGDVSPTVTEAPATETPTPSPPPTETETPTPSATPEPSATPTATDTVAPTVTATPTATTDEHGHPESTQTPEAGPAAWRRASP